MIKCFVFVTFINRYIYIYLLIIEKILFFNIGDFLIKVIILNSVMKILFDRCLLKIIFFYAI